MALRATGWVAIALMATLAACGSNDETDGGVQDSGFDAGPTDAGEDGGLVDAGEDGGLADAGEDGGLADAGEDGGLADAGEDGGPADAGEDGGVAATAAVRVIHLSPDAPNVDVYNAADTTAPVVADLAFPDTTAYLEVPPGTYSFDVVAAGGDPTSPVLSVPDVALDADTDYTVAAYDLVADLKALPLVDDNSVPPTGELRFRAVHTATGIGQVDIYNIVAGGPPQLLFENLDFGTASAYAEVPAGDYTIGIDVDDDGVPDVRFRTGPLPAGISANVFAVNDPSSGDVFLIAQPQIGDTIRIDATPMGPDGGMMDAGM